jgi:hypothetical protein
VNVVPTVWRRWPLLAIVGLVLASATVRFAVSLSFDAPWIAPDEMIYGLVGRSFWATGHGSVLGAAAPFYGVYPLLVGLPLHLLGPATGVTAMQLCQAILMSLTAAIVWAWARPLTGDGWALTAAALAACLPALAYSGLLMTEAAFLPAGTLALWLGARAIAQPSRARQFVLVCALVLAGAARFQGVVLAPILVTAALLAAWFARDARLLLRLAPTWIALLGLAALWVGAQLALHGGLGGGLGAYGVAATTGYDAGEAARWVLRHAGDLFLLVLGIPLVAAGVLAYGAARSREHDAGVRALIAVSVSTSIWLTLQVGVFASRYVGQLAERDLIVAAPPLFTCLAVWLARGLPRPQPATSIIAVAIAAPAVLLPIRTLVTPSATPDAFMTVPLARLIDATSGSVAEATWMLIAASLVTVAVILPRRAAVAVPIVVGLALAGSSALSSAEIAKLTRVDREKFFGAAAPTWIDDAATGPVTYLYGDSGYWNLVWSTAFWNDRIKRVARLPDSPSGSLPGGIVAPRYDGRLFDTEGRPVRGREVVASTSFTLFGEPVAEIAQTDIDQAGLRLWRTDGVFPRLSTWTTGLQPNGDIVQPVRVYVYACGRGTLDLTLFGKQGTPVEIDVDGVPAVRVTPPPGGVWNGSVPTPARADGATRCTYEIRSSGLVGSTKIVFVRA